MNELEVNLIKDTSVSESISKFLKSMREQCDSGSIVKITMLNETHLSAQYLQELFEDVTSMWFVEESIMVDTPLLQHLELDKEVPISLIVTINDLHYFMIRGNTACGFINDKIPASTAANIAKAIHRICSLN